MNGKRLELIGKQFGRLIVQEFAGIVGNCSTWRCLCECGTELVVQGENLVQGNSKSCGCSRRINIRKGKLSNEEIGLREYFSGYRSRAKTAGRTWELTFEEARNLFQARCHWCDAAPDIHEKKTPAPSSPGCKILSERN